MKTGNLRHILFALLVLISTASLRANDATAVAAPPASGPSAAAALEPFVQSHSLAGAVTLVADKDKVISLETVGWADVAAKRPMTPDTLFWIASQSKPITATALMILVDEGKVNIDDPVEKYLPEFKGQRLAGGGEPKHPITVRNVLSHTSGLPFKSGIENPTLDQLPLAERVRSYATTPLDFEPDSKWNYSNAGINTAGRIIEVVSGMPYETFLDTRLFGPLGMKDTTFWPSSEQIARLAKPYKPNADKNDLEEITIGQLKYPLDDHAGRQPMPAGGLFSTAGDLAKFCQMLLNGGEYQGKRYLSEAAIKQMTSKQTGDLPNEYGLGWSTGGGGFGHGGAFATDMSIDPKRGLITIWLIQHAGFPGNGQQAHGTFKHVAEEQLAASKK
ncbi:MAG TPA: serine hydrolase domain-containing protein [Pirellulales bacterium]|jgi:CubicO group peptidase (beta-lactamase class C family)|nr:serine hydrolase domain-containing protein [Pirellulales bacterium]